MRSHCPKPCMKTKNKRSFKHFDPDVFLRDVCQTLIHVAYVFDDVDDVVWAWKNMFTGLLDEHAPIKKKVIRLNKLTLWQLNCLMLFVVDAN